MRRSGDAKADTNLHKMENVTQPIEDNVSRNPIRDGITIPILRLRANPLYLSVGFVSFFIRGFEVYWTLQYDSGK